MIQLRPPYQNWSADRLLDYFRTRTHVRYFPVLDVEQTTRAKIDGVLENRFDFHGEAYQLPGAFDWTANPSRDIEWLIMLHKFYYAVGLGKAYQETRDPRYAETWMALTSSWIDNVPMGFLSSDVAGRRMQNWIFAHYYFVTCAPQLTIPAAFYLKFLQALATQVNHICAHLTPERNHRTIELYAIFLAAVVFPEFQEASRWLQLATTELVANICTDLLPDGVHCELSTDYHHLVLKNYLGIRNLARLNHIELPPAVDARLRKALEFALYVHKPDGLIPSLSDGDSRGFLDLLAQGYALYQDETMQYVVTRGRCGRPPTPRSKAFPAGGYYIMRSAWRAEDEPFEDARYLIFDCGPLGRGNHGHFDLLSFEMAAYGQSLIVDPGRYTYDESGETNWRARFRGTAYHNTVQVDRHNQTCYAFHKTRFKIRGPEPEWELRQWISREGFDYVHGVARSHEYEATHERAIFFTCAEQGPDYWIISDILQAEEMHDYDLRFHLSDRAYQQVVTAVEDGTVQVQTPHLVIAQPAHPGIKLVVEDGYVSRTYGVKHAAPVVRFSQRAIQAAYHTVLYPYKVPRPRIAVTNLPVFRHGRLCATAQASAQRITFRLDDHQCTDLFFRAQPGGSAPYTFAEYTYAGTLLFIRCDAGGRIVALHGEECNGLRQC